MIVLYCNVFNQESHISWKYVCITLFNIMLAILLVYFWFCAAIETLSWSSEILILGVQLWHQKLHMGIKNLKKWLVSNYTYLLCCQDSFSGVAKYFYCSWIIDTYLSLYMHFKAFSSTKANTIYLHNVF